MKSPDKKCWPVLVEYDQEHLRRIAMPLGGIGTGTVSLGGRGDLRDWEIVNRPAKGFSPRFTFFALNLQLPGGQSITRAIEGPVEPVDYEGAAGSNVPNHGLPRFRHCRFLAAYPFGQVLLSDPEVPVDVRLEAFNPLVPGDAEVSGLPVAVLRFVLTNNSEECLSASVCGNVNNFIGTDGSQGAPCKNVNEFRSATDQPSLSGILMRSVGVSPQAEQFGTMALTTLAASGISCRTAWANLSWGDTLLDYWDDFSEDGRLEDRDSGGVDAPMASLAVNVDLAPGETQSVTFLLAWHFPNRMTWTPRTHESEQTHESEAKKGEEEKPADCCGANAVCDPNRVGNYYTTQYKDAYNVAVRVASELPRLESETLEWVRAFCESDLPQVVKESALFNLSTFRTQTCFRTEDGRFFGWEGCHDRVGCCPGSCTHVWNYEQATAFLFGELACSMRDTEFTHATRDDGLMSFRTHLPLDRATESGLAAADGQMGCLMKLYRDWQLSGDDEMLRRFWPKARKSLEFCWAPGGWDANKDGVMEGCQHNTMDVEYFGPNPQMGAWYLGALRAAEEMAGYLGDATFADTCRDLFESGRQWMDTHLFNGEYYEHEIRPPKDETCIAPGLQPGYGAANLADPELQLGAGCLVDQLVGQFLSHVCGLGYLLDEQNVRQTLRSILRYNSKENLYGHFNHLRSFALNEESALLMATYPRGRRPRRPFPYYNEVMTGFEYSTAVHTLYEGMIDEGVAAIAAIRSRYDGNKRNPFDEAECGHHYARAMASWGAVLALTGFRYSGVTQTIEFAAASQPTRWFWSNGYACGLCEQEPAPDHINVTLTVFHGSLKLRRIVLTQVGSAEVDISEGLTAGRSLQLRVSLQESEP
ncbi:MAG: hypothetical protein HY318_14660 [Armatimonadetes bacterium]|nr:hypothetical protein [Armatimonadota bacterium]